ncbi:MAG: nucleotidyltransferase family protein [Chlamydiae bacterium]|nr:nucleotidyltransferase family protein [Chlamydiota bacterium]MBI3265575.1 nucleotidyltransferase family protein [Chlamydiota bacterium]
MNSYRPEEKLLIACTRLARISHHISAASADSASSLRADLVGHAQHTVKYASHGLGRLPRIQGGLRRSSPTKFDEKCGLGIFPGRTQEIQTLLHGQINWNYFLQIIFRHRLSSLVYSVLKKFFVQDVPAPFLAELYESFQIESRNTLLKVRELIPLLNLFEGRGIPAIPYKGPILAMALYGDISLREYLDLDILIRREDVMKARGILTSQGYEPRFSLSVWQQAFLLEYDCEQSFSKEGVRVDLHWGTDLKHLSFSRFSDQNLWENLDEINFGGRTLRTFSPENLLLILCFHGAKHGWSCLNWICDMACLICKHSQIDWQGAFRKARELNGERMLLLGLCLARDLYTVELPDELIQRIDQDLQVLSLARRIKKRLFQKRDAWTRFWNDVIYLRAMEGLGNRFHHGLRYVMPTPAEWLAIPLPQILYPLYYFLRPMRLLVKYVCRLFRKSPKLDLSLFVPAPLWVVEKMLELAQVKSDDVVYDLGCGDGRMVVMAAQRWGARGIGVDVDPQRIREAKDYAQREGVEHLVKFLRQDAKKTQVSTATLLMLNLPSTAYPKLKPLLERLRSGTRIVTRIFYLDHLTPLKQEVFKDDEKFTHVLYLYEVP